MADEYEPIYEVDLEDGYEDDVSGWVLAWLIVCALAGVVFMVALLMTR